MNKKKRKGWIEPAVASQIFRIIPVPTADLIIQRSDGSVLLLKRKNYPAKNKWWLPGGKIDFKEKLEQAALRIAEGETGIKVRVERQLGVVEFFFKKGWFGNPCHPIANVFLVRPLNEFGKVQLDDQSASYRWTKTLPKYLHRYLLNVPELSYLLKKVTGSCRR